jgi:hypothetical protein
MTTFGQQQTLFHKMELAENARVACPVKRIVTRKISGMGSHQSHCMGKEEWLTPPEIIKDLGVFDLDPCSPVNRPWDTAVDHYTVNDDGLSKKWFGFVWCNPPYGAQTGKWLKKLSEHGSGVALIFARTETKMFFDYVWNKAHALLFIKGRLYFHHVDGRRASSNAGAPSVLVGYGREAADRLSSSKIKGKFIELR